MRKQLFSALCLIGVTASAALPEVEWQTLGNATDSDGRAYYTQRFTIDNTKGLKRLCFNMFAREMQAVDPRDTVAEIVPGYYYIATPRFDKGGTVAVDVKTVGTLSFHSYMPDGTHGVMSDGSVVPAKLTRLKISDRPEQWSLPGKDRMPDGAAIYDFNATVNTATPGAFDIIPSLKSVKLCGKGSAPAINTLTERAISHENPEFYRIDMSGDKIVIEYASDRARILANTTLQQLLAANGENGIPRAVIEDYPDFGYRGVMIDISRNFLPISDLQKFAQYLSRYRFNKLHLHFADDEAWRLEIPGLDELTNVGSRRGYTLDESDYMAQIFTGNGNPNSTEGSSNGYITRQEFVDFLRYCKTLGIDVIPEVESPGHARAAIKAMENRYAKTGDASLRLIEDGDTSTYTSAQAFHDNIMNPALEGPYRFLEIVFDELKKMYDEAGVELTTIHIGGDEVANHGWDGAPSVQKMKAELGLNTQTEVHAEFVKRIAHMLESKGLKMSGWMEVATGHTPEYDAEIPPLTAGIYFWSTTKTSKAPIAAKAGYPVVVCNVDHFYLDQSYNLHPEERGLTWGGAVDEFASLHGYPWEMCPVDSAYRNNVIGLSGQIFAETIRDFPQVQTYLFPKALGLAERCWNAEPTYSDAEFNAVIGQRELLSMARRGIAFHLRQPGVKVEDGRIMMNAPYPGAKIHYTLDGSNPTASSPEYDQPIDAQGVEQVRAAITLYGTMSLPTITYIK